MKRTYDFLTSKDVFIPTKLVIVLSLYGSVAGMTTIYVGIENRVIDNLAQFILHLVEIVIALIPVAVRLSDMFEHLDR